MKSLSLICLFCFFALITYAQNKQEGKVLEYKTNIPLSGIKVENLSSHQSTVSDTTGTFSIDAKVGDLLGFSGLTYLRDTVYLTDLKTRPFFLTLQQNLLKEVKIVNVEFKPGMFSAQPIPGPFGSSVVRYQTDKNGNPIGGIKMSLSDLIRSKRNVNRGKQKVANSEREAQVAKVFNAQNLQQYLPIKGQEMDNFITLFIPDANTYFSPSFNLLTYLNTNYKSFLEIPAEQRQSKEFLKLQ